MTNDTYGIIVVRVALLVLLLLLICSFVVSLKKIDFMYITLLIVFLIKFKMMR